MRIAAVATVLACVWCLSFLAVGAYTEGSYHPKFLLFLGLMSVLPILFIWESVRAWRFLPKSVESLSVIWAFCGVGGIFYGLVPGFSLWLAN